MKTQADCFAKAKNNYDKAMIQIKMGGLSITDPAYANIKRDHGIALKGLQSDEYEQMEQLYTVSWIIHKWFKSKMDSVNGEKDFFIIYMYSCCN